MKISKRFGIGCAIVVALLGLVSLVVYYLVVADVPPPDLSDLKVKRRVVAAADNGFLLVDISEADFHQDTESALEVLSRGDTWDSDEARDILEKNKAVLDLFDQCLEKPDFQVREHNPTEQMALYSGAWRLLGGLIQHRATLALEEGRSNAAVEAAFELGEFGRRIQNAQGVLVTHMVGAAYEARAVRLLTRAILAGGHDVPALKKVIQRLDAWRNGDAALKDSLRGEFWVAAWPVANGQLVGSTWARLLIAENDTTRKLADVFRTRIANVSRRPSERQAIDEEALTGGVQNVIGRQIVAHFVPGMDYFLASRDIARLRVEIARAVAGLRGHVLEHGKLPERLDELVPHYLVRVPVDIFDGKPLRYSREKRILYSVGEDGVDSGGSSDAEEPGWHLELDEPTYRLDPGIVNVRDN